MDRVFAGVVIDRVAAVLDVARELGPLCGDVLQRLTQQAAGQHGVQVLRVTVCGRMIIAWPQLVQTLHGKWDFRPRFSRRNTFEQITVQI